jgi:hypothetical protein
MALFYLSGESFRLRGKKKYLEANVPVAEFPPSSFEEENEEIDEQQGGDEN